jgi:hypothetical protein
LICCPVSRARYLLLVFWLRVVRYFALAVVTFTLCVTFSCCVTNPATSLMVSSTVCVLAGGALAQGAEPPHRQQPQVLLLRFQPSDSAYASS